MRTIQIKQVDPSTGTLEDVSFSSIEELLFQAEYLVSTSEIERYLLVSQIDFMENSINSMKKVSKPVSRDDLIVIANVLDKMSNRNIDDSMFMGRDLADFDVPTELSSLILPGKVVMDIGNPRKAMDYRWHVSDERIDEIAKAVAGSRSVSIDYVRYRMAVEAVYALFKRTPNMKSLSDVNVCAVYSGDTIEAAATGRLLYKSGVRPVPMITGPVTETWRMHDGDEEMRDYLYNVFRTIADGRSRTVDSVEAK